MVTLQSITNVGELLKITKDISYLIDILANMVSDKVRGVLKYFQNSIVSERNGWSLQSRRDLILIKSKDLQVRPPIECVPDTCQLSDNRLVVVNTSNTIIFYAKPDPKRKHLVLKYIFFIIINDSNIYVTKKCAREMSKPIYNIITSRFMCYHTSFLLINESFLRIIYGI